MSRGRIAKTIEDIIHKASAYVTAEVLKEDAEYRQRDKCTACRAPKQWFELKPGDGRCNNCAP
jgi:hypothetical protein